MAKEWGMVFPLEILIAPHFEASLDCWNYFGGSHLACAASIAVLDVIEQQNLMAMLAKLKPISWKRLK
jgi:acetylornithine aminotransferase